MTQDPSPSGSRPTNSAYQYEQLTPRKASRINESGSEHLGLEEQRNLLRESSESHTVTVPTALFSKFYTRLPFDETLGVQKARVALEKEQHWDAQQGFVGLVKKEEEEEEEEEEKRNEDSIFKTMEKIVECVVASVNKDNTEQQRRTTTFRCDPHNTTNSEVRGGSMQTDAHFFLAETSSAKPPHPNSKPFTVDVTTSAQFQLSATDRYNNERQLLNDASHILFSDPCRRFMFGLTVEDETMRLWWFSKAYIAVTHEFNFHAESPLDPEIFIRFIIFQSFGSRTALGYDNTVKRVLDDNSLTQYRYLIDGKWYQTVRRLDESKLDIASRSTRVWAVRLVDEEDELTGEELALKDVWTHEGMKSELENQTQIYIALEELDKDRLAGKLSPTEEKNLPPVEISLLEDAKKFFMTIVADECVVVAADEGEINGGKEGKGIDDREEGEECSGDGHLIALPGSQDAFKPPRSFSRFNYAAEPKPAYSRPGTVSSSLNGTSNPVPRTKHQKGAFHKPKGRVHHRVLFKEVCRSLYQVAAYPMFGRALSELFVGLFYLRLAQHVHRDISPGNCLLHVQPGRSQVKISDLEYARAYDAESSRTAPLAGTPAYMAVEYQRRKHLFLPTKQSEQSADLDTILDFSQPFGGPPHTRKNSDWFRYCYFHDVESAIWMYADRLFNWQPSVIDGNATLALRKAVCLHALKIFDGTLEGSREREELISFYKDKLPSVYSEPVLALQELYECVSCGQRMIDVFRRALYTLVSAYKHVEDSDPDDAQSAKSRWSTHRFELRFYTTITLLFERLAKDTEQVSYTAVPAPDIVELEPPSPNIIASEPPPPFLANAHTSSITSHSRHVSPSPQPRKKARLETSGQ